MCRKVELLRAGRGTGWLDVPGTSIGLDVDAGRGRGCSIGEGEFTVTVGEAGNAGRGGEERAGEERVVLLPDVWLSECGEGGTGEIDLMVALYSIDCTGETIRGGAVRLVS